MIYIKHSNLFSIKKYTNKYRYRRPIINSLNIQDLTPTKHNNYDFIS